MTHFEKCWDIKQCPNKDISGVFPDFGRSCWLIRGKLRFVFGEDRDFTCQPDCASCEVYVRQSEFLKLADEETAWSPRTSDP